MSKSRSPDTPGPMSRITAMLCQLPGISPQQSLRIAAHLAAEPPESVENLASLVEAAQRSGKCPECGGLSDEQEQNCSICADPGRPHDALCLVEQPTDLAAVERSGAYAGRYHVIDQLIDQKGNVQVEDTRVPQLVQRVKESAGGIEEVIVATDPNPDGDYTAEYVAEALGRLPKPPRVTRPAMGLPSGSGPEYIDETTVRRSIQDRRPA